jgi:hypothetical protein
MSPPEHGVTRERTWYWDASLSGGRLSVVAIVLAPAEFITLCAAFGLKGISASFPLFFLDRVVALRMMS